jgi:serine/threonine protein kinase
LTPLSDAAVARLRSVATWPEFSSGRYTVTEQIGRGGMGTVYLARDTELGRDVAIKVPHVAVSSTLEQRLQTEARVLARLEHPGIVPIHDVGRLADGRLFYVMKQVHGQTLRDYLRETPDMSDSLRIFERICEPVAFAHAHGCIHRDLKPENVMIGQFGEVMVMDWGVARMESSPALSLSNGPALSLSNGPALSLSNGPELVATRAGVEAPSTNPGTIVGTMGFMAPEQAAGATSDHRADVFSLGAILYSLLVREEPGSDAAAAIARRRDVPRPLRAICTRALAPAVGERYQSVSALAHDVAQFRIGGRLSAYRETLVERSMRVARTYRVAILLMLTYIVMRVVVAFVFGR